MLLEFDTTDVLCGRALQYFEGDGVAADLTEALRLFSLAAERGNPHAQLFLGILNEYGKGMANGIVWPQSRVMLMPNAILEECTKMAEA